ncbi:MAG TPA: biopolymer transporter ExbD [Kofleriaceae bacterium]|nr:biopolymer transporter ExbD [Kofleriaceae bacterium]
MSVGDNSGGPKNDINVTPLIDVVLVLLIIFLVTMPIMMRTITLEVPRKINEQTEQVASTTKQITVLVKSDLSVTLNTGDRELEIAFTDLTKELVPLLQDRKTDKLVFVDFEPQVKWGDVVATMDSVRRVAADQLRKQDPNSGADPIDIKVALKMKDDKDKPVE